MATEYKNLNDAIRDARARGRSEAISAEFAAAFVTLYKGTLDDGALQLWRDITDCGCEHEDVHGDGENFCTTTVTDDDVAEWEEEAQDDDEPFNLVECLKGWEHFYIEVNDERPAPAPVLIVLEAGIVEAVEVGDESASFECAHLDILKDMDSGDGWDELSAPMQALIRRDYPEVAAEAEAQAKANSKHRYGV